MKTLNLYIVTLKDKSGKFTLNVAAATLAKAKQQTKNYMVAGHVVCAKRIGNVNVPLTLPAGL